MGAAAALEADWPHLQPAPPLHPHMPIPSRKLRPTAVKGWGRAGRGGAGLGLDTGCAIAIARREAPGAAPVEGSAAKDWWEAAWTAGWAAPAAVVVDNRHAAGEAVAPLSGCRADDGCGGSTAVAAPRGGAARGGAAESREGACPPVRPVAPGPGRAEPRRARAERADEGKRRASQEPSARAVHPSPTAQSPGACL